MTTDMETRVTKYMRENEFSFKLQQLTALFYRGKKLPKTPEKHKEVVANMGRLLRSLVEQKILRVVTYETKEIYYTYHSHTRPEKADSLGEN